MSDVLAVYLGAGEVVAPPIEVDGPLPLVALPVPTEASAIRLDTERLNNILLVIVVLLVILAAAYIATR